ncbi:hypothetical protein FACS189494_08600 [Spirochaetia bacterium]|nr:hypothetical protein FACS189494_08600 [Spirochaetia bacterium]
MLFLKIFVIDSIKKHTIAKIITIIFGLSVLNMMNTEIIYDIIPNKNDIMPNSIFVGIVCGVVSV